MKNFKSGGFGGKKNFGNDRGPRRGDGAGMQMHRAICADCGKECQVPFRPTGDRPIYCSDCFGQHDGGQKKRFDRELSSRPSFADKKMFKAICDKCHKECEVPFRPNGEKPVYCKDCFSRPDRPVASFPAGASGQYEKQFELMNNKLDRILRVLAPQEVPVKAAVIETTAAKIAPKVMVAEKPMVKPFKKSAPKPVAVKKPVAKKKAATPKKTVKKPAKKK